MNKILLGGLALIIVAGGAYFIFGGPGSGTSQTQGQVLPYGSVTLALGKVATFKDISITPVSIEEDSRCPSDVECIQAGTVRVKVDISSGMGKSTSILKLGEVFTTEGEAITLTDVLPGKVSTVHISTGDYRLTFKVVKQGTADTGNSGGKCYVGGCSAQVCSDQPDLVSTCEYSSAYACYKTAKCERQANSQCGWTPTKELTSCLNNAQSSNNLPQ